MREIKARTCVKKDKEMICGRRAFGVKMFTPDYAYTDNEVEVMLYTGLKDINGKDVYEGDILDKTKWIVTYVDSSDNANLGLPIGWYEQRDNFESYRQLEVGDHVEVVGNIYENPDIMK